MRDTAFFKYIFLNVPTVLGALVVVMVIIVLIFGFKHRNRLMEEEQQGSNKRVDADLDGKDHVALREVGLSSAGVGNMYRKSDKKKDDAEG